MHSFNCFLVVCTMSYLQGHVQLYLMELPPNKKPKPPGPPFHALKMSKMVKL